MRIKGRLVFKNENAGMIACSLAPDNPPDIETLIDSNAVVTFTADRIGTILSSVDDYLMNATIVEKLSYSLKDIRK